MSKDELFEMIGETRREFYKLLDNGFDYDDIDNGYLYENIEIALYHLGIAKDILKGDN